MADPYRSSGGNACPQCGSPLDLASGAGAPCPNGCGQWLPRAFVATLFDASAELTREPHGHEVMELQHFAPPPCPTCSAPLVRAWLGAAPVRLCSEHGVWIAAASTGRFEAQLVAPMERHRRLVELVAQLGSSDNASRVEVARRVIALEDRVAALEAALAGKS